MSSNGGDGAELRQRRRRRRRGRLCRGRDLRTVLTRKLRQAVGRELDPLVLRLAPTLEVDADAPCGELIIRRVQLDHLRIVPAVVTKIENGQLKAHRGHLGGGLHNRRRRRCLRGLCGCGCRRGGKGRLSQGRWLLLLLLLRRHRTTTHGRSRGHVRCCGGRPVVSRKDAETARLLIEEYHRGDALGERVLRLEAK